MKQICVIFRQSPLGNSSSREGLDFALLSASFEQQVSVVFTDEAVLHLLANQQPELVGSKDYLSTFKALNIYDIETVLVCEQSAKQFGITEDKFNFEAQLADSNAIKQLLAQSDEVVVY
ncbi:sulfurtransferase complex subunit TusC [Shewanella sp. 10N.286.51.B2]|uniref:sulfurtransferase complex subunit TusC n=1 Tax=unclassified Shewanella TaxID=196818 RepID=UPI0026E1F810|nr:sulfurtransferase complex subunit TusC [Shewanella sp. 4_MG-2023]MDO6678896.1 sulfurtransferase complex subunit TusC [Shewanella sp. 4_MG-2023]